MSLFQFIPQRMGNLSQNPHMPTTKQGRCPWRPWPRQGLDTIGMESFPGHPRWTAAGWQEILGLRRSWHPIPLGLNTNTHMNELVSQNVEVPKTSTMFFFWGVFHFLGGTDSSISWLVIDL